MTAPDDKRAQANRLFAKAAETVDRREREALLRKAAELNDEAERNKADEARDDSPGDDTKPTDPPNQG